MVDLVTAGEAFDDFVFYNLPALPAPGHELKTDAFLQTSGGGAVITAVAAARLGLRVHVASPLSRDAVARLRRERIGVTNLRRVNELPAVTVALSTRRDRRYVTFNGTTCRLPQRILAVLPRLRARHVHLALHPGRCRLWLSAIRRLRGRGATVSWDFGWNPDLPRDGDFGRLVDTLDYLFLNRDEARTYRARPRGGVAVIKLGAEGSRAVGAGIDLRTPAPRVRAVDTTGAGDVFDGAFLAATLCGEPLRAALRLANRTAAESTRHPGGLS